MHEPANIFFHSYKILWFPVLKPLSCLLVNFQLTHLLGKMQESFVVEAYNCNLFQAIFPTFSFP